MSAARRHPPALALAAVTVLLAFVPAADAATVEVNSGRLRVPVPPSAAGSTLGTAAQVTPTSDGGALVAIYGNTAESMSAGPGCQQVANSNAPAIAQPNINPSASFAASCSLSDVRIIEGRLLAPARPGQVWQSSMNLPTNVTSTAGVDNSGASGDTIITGNGGDRITGGDGPDEIDAGGAPYKGQEALPPSGNVSLDDPDRNFVDGGSGNDKFKLARGTARDVVTGGNGIDLATYAGRFTIGAPGSAGVQVSLDGTANDGDPNIDPPDSTVNGEADNIGIDVENVDGTKRDDRLVGNGLGNVLFGDEGVDTFTGNAGEDVILAREPATAGSGTPDVISCGSPFPPTNRTNAFGVITASGYDRLQADLADPRPADCELLVDMAVDEPAPVDIATKARLIRGKRLAVRLKCPRKAKRTCKGRLHVGGKRRGSKDTKFTIRGGGKRVVKLRLTAAAGAALAKPRAAARLVSNETGLKGDVTRVAFAEVR